MTKSNLEKKMNSNGKPIIKSPPKPKPVTKKTTKK